MANTSFSDVLDCWAATSVSSVVSEAPRGFSGADVQRVETTTGAFALRCWPAGRAGLPLARIRELHRWLAWLAEQGVAILAVPLRSRDGSTIVERRGRLWQLEPWLPGSADFHANPNDARLRSAFAALARLHLASARFVPTDAGATWFHAGRGIPSSVQTRLEQLRALRKNPIDGAGALLSLDPPHRAVVARMTALLIDAVPRTLAELSAVTTVEMSLHPCLRDVWHDHVLFTGDAATGIIDPSAAKSESVASDLSRLLGSFLGNTFDRWETALEAYAAIRPLSREERRLIPLLDRSGVVLSTAHWLERLQSQPLGEREWNRVQSLAERLQAFADRIAPFS
ncbi:MAG: phosphotransferase [Planctomycetaceae bacterium]|nr:phosphotransferase [Planctomycetaceae bacterium]